MEKNDIPKIDEEYGEEKEKRPLLGKFVPWFQGLGALIIFIIFRSCGVDLS
jgi:hypothetical protein